MVHCGSRGFEHQVASDYLKVFEKSIRRYGITVKDQQLACAPFRSPEGQEYFSAMNCAANTAFADRQVITHQIREAFATVFGRSAEALGMELVYDVAHNIAKVERYAEGELVVHRKGATRAFGPGSPELPETFRQTGQPVICGGSMETGSYLLVGTDQAVRDTFGSRCTGPGDHLPCASEESGSWRTAAAADETARYSGQGRIDVGPRGGSRPGLQEYI